jgi:16S rRNA (uracil1498-N3)-methyltransferase
VATAASEQCGRTVVPQLAPVAPLLDWLRSPPASTGHRLLLSLRDAMPFAAPMGVPSMVFLSGPEGGLSEAEENAAREAGFTPVSLGPRVLRADTAPLAVLAALGLLS